jgi:hypothetical protein
VKPTMTAANMARASHASEGVLRVRGI